MQAPAICGEACRLDEFRLISLELFPGVPASHGQKEEKREPVAILIGWVL